MLDRGGYGVLSVIEAGGTGREGRTGGAGINCP